MASSRSRSKASRWIRRAMKQAISILRMFRLLPIWPRFNTLPGSADSRLWFRLGSRRWWMWGRFDVSFLVRSNHERCALAGVARRLGWSTLPRSRLGFGANQLLHHKRYLGFLRNLRRLLNHRSHFDGQRNLQLPPEGARHQGVAEQGSQRADQRPAKDGQWRQSTELRPLSGCQLQYALGR